MKVWLSHNILRYNVHSVCPFLQWFFLHSAGIIFPILPAPRSGQRAGARPRSGAGREGTHPRPLGHQSGRLYLSISLFLFFCISVFLYFCISVFLYFIISVFLYFRQEWMAPWRRWERALAEPAATLWTSQMRIELLRFLDWHSTSLFWHNVA